MRDAAAAAGAPLAILAGGGEFPVAVARSAIAQNRPVLILGIEGEASPDIGAFPHVWIRRGQLGRLFAELRRHGARDLVMIGGMRQRRLPTFAEIDIGGVWAVLRHLTLLRRGDDGVLRIIARIIESHGFRVVGAADVAPELTVGKGVLGACRPDIDDWRDILAGYDAAKDLGARDRGQAVVASDGLVLMREGADGTDAMLGEIEADRLVDGFAGRSGVLVKCLKPRQDRRLDMPAIGPETVMRTHAAGLKGIAVEAHETLVADWPTVLKALDRCGLFLVGFDTALLDGARQPGQQEAEL